MMVFQNNTKRTSTNDIINSMDTKKRKVEFAKDVTLYQFDQDGQNNTEDSSEFSTAIYLRFVKSALEDLDKVCYFFLRVLVTFTHF